ncbi:MAG: TlpA family protein disulfide reductase [Acidimicrobiales bacterium]|jgi:cytochrome c biogenesis protein CcmG, thiol:disulfide interchange protein DsbE
MTNESPEIELESRRISAWMVGPVAVVVGVLLLILATADPAPNALGSGAVLGEVAPLVQGPTADGGSFDLDDQRGRWVVVNFFASWCPPCRLEHPELTEFVARHEQSDAVLVSVAMTDRQEDILAFFDELGGNWPVLYDDTTTAVIDYAVTAPPTTFLVTPNGVVVEQFIGPVTADQLDASMARFESPAE